MWVLFWVGGWSTTASEVFSSPISVTLLSSLLSYLKKHRKHIFVPEFLFVCSFICLFLTVLHSQMLMTKVRTEYNFTGFYVWASSLSQHVWELFSWISPVSWQVNNFTCCHCALPKRKKKKKKDLKALCFQRLSLLFTVFSRSQEWESSKIAIPLITFFFFFFLYQSKKHYFRTLSHDHVDKTASI